MNNLERDKFLTERVHLAWFDGNLSLDEIPVVDFSTWEGFGKLWEWVKKQTWFCNFYWHYFITDDGRAVHLVHTAKLNPDSLASVLYEYIKENEHNK